MAQQHIRRGGWSRNAPAPATHSTWLGQALSMGWSGTALPSYPKPASAGELCNTRAWPGKRSSPQSRVLEQEPEDAPGNAGARSSAPSFPLASALCPFMPLPGCNSASPLGGSTRSTFPHLFSQSANFY